ncbi:MAG TPA: biopolymer transporter ExbD [Bdellovibrionales bacterium]|nr:biopolymer transporter ExbD [Bdellovibrionales bacterium]
MMNPNESNKKNLDFELNLLPVFDVLSACICFLLMTAVWVQVSSMDVQQALGGQSIAETKNPPSIWAYMNKNGQLTLTLKDAKGVTGMPKELAIGGRDGSIAWNKLSNYVKHLQAKAPQVQTALIMPNESSQYDDIIRLMDQFRSGGVKNIGISPL